MKILIELVQTSFNGNHKNEDVNWMDRQISFTDVSPLSSTNKSWNKH